jgi:NagD protein
MIGFLIDMDGVIYRGGKLIPGADRFIERLKAEHIPFRFLTNNSQRTRRDVAMRLRAMGIDVTDDHIYTCAMATARFLAQQKPNGSAYVIGEGGLLNALHENGYAVVDKDPDYVVVGEGRTFSAENLDKALNMINNGSRLVATNLDPNCPTDAGWRIGCGAIVALLEAASGRKAFSVGKPSPVMMRDARKIMDLGAAHTIMIGDTMETDILGGVSLGYRTALVLTGSTTRDDLGRFTYQPTWVFDSIAEIDPEDLARRMFDGRVGAEAAIDYEQSHGPFESVPVHAG